jgi:hypothetical protein
MALENSKAVMDFSNDCHDAGGRFCAGLSSVKDNARLSDVSKNYPERVGSLNAALSAIDSVHGLPAGFPPCSIEIWSEMGGAKGAYNQGEHLIKLAEDAGAYQSSTLCHEFGHHITLGEKGQGKVEFYKELSTDPELKAWHNAVKATPQFLHFHNIEGSVTATQDARDYASYLKDPRELFARSYSQWIATRSGNKTLLDQHAKLKNMADGMYQWSDSEFKPIGAALDAYFSKRGLLR